MVSNRSTSLANPSDHSISGRVARPYGLTLFRRWLRRWLRRWRWLFRRVRHSHYSGGKLEGVATVNTHERIIRDRFMRNTCTTCGVYHTADDVLVLARRSRAWLVLVTCHECQRRGIFVVTFPRAAKSNDANTPNDAAGSQPGTANAINATPNRSPMWPDLWQEPELRIERQALQLPPNPDAKYQSSFQTANDDSAPARSNDASATPPPAPYTSPAPATPLPAVTHVDVDAMRRFLSAFDGDFQRLFNLGNLGEQA